jgi:pantothenate kinase
MTVPHSALFSGHSALLGRIKSLCGDRVIIAVAGPPGAGKSTLAESLADCLNADLPGSAAVIPMDGFHYDDAVLDARSLRSRKGSAPTFDVAGFRHLLQRLRAKDDVEVAVPVFDRRLEISRAGARIVPAAVRYLIAEGNYLLLQEAPWSGLASCFDLTVMIDEPRELLERRLIDRWLSFGFDEMATCAKVSGNDFPNLELVLKSSRTPDVIVRSLPAKIHGRANP